MSILGKHTITEAREFAAVIEFQVQAEDKLIAKHQPLPQDDKTVAAVARYLIWRDKWRAVSGKVLNELTLLSLASPLIPASVQAVEPQYKRLQLAVNKSGDDSFTDPGDMRNLMDAVDSALGEQADLSGFRKQFPASPGGFDPDLEAFKKLDAATKAGESAAKAAKDAAKTGIGAIPWYGWVGGAAVAGAVGYVYVSPFLPRRR